MSENIKVDRKQQKLDKKAEKLKKFQQKKQNINEAPKKAKTETKILKLEEYTGNTLDGEKKDISIPLPNTYSPKFTSACWYSWWEKQGFFKPEYNSLSNNDRQKFVVVMPPPNVTGTLHLGHALMCAIEDVIVRFHRMNNKQVLWNPGSDHAGIATQVVVERQIKALNNKTRFDLGREEFIKQVWIWKEEKGSIISNQMKNLGVSCDWSRNFFSMDDNLNKAVCEAFIRLYNSKLIYRANRLVNWSCSLNSVISDIEVDKIEINGRTYLQIPNYPSPIEFGTMTYFDYFLEDGSGKVTVATTRIETMLGDVAVILNPNDERYKSLHGKFVVHPFCNRKMPIILDDTIDIEFGTGAMKLTPSHDFNDYEIAQRHKLEFINIFTDSGVILDIKDMEETFKSIFVGKKRFDVRKIIIEELKKMNLFGKTVPHNMVLPMCSRTKDVIEPMLKSQWYIDCKNMAEDAVKVVENKELELIPASFEKQWFYWMRNHKDWCISRQLWWGHRIPAFKIIEPKHLQNEDWIIAKNETEAKEKAIKLYNINSGELLLEQDQDVLDTWFSAGLFPFAIFGWPNEESPDFKNFFPTHVLETGYDILFFWVARMVMLSRQLTKKLPFTQVYLHTLIRDAHGRKMSKSLGNIIDPLDVINGSTLKSLNEQLMKYNLDPKELEKAIKGQEKDFPQGIPECGADSLRFALCSYLQPGNDINLDILRVKGYSSFCNKIWNAYKFLNFNMEISQYEEIQKSYNQDCLDLIQEANLIDGKLTLLDIWILSRLDYTVKKTREALTNYQFPIATTTIFNYWLYDLCDVYIESIKTTIKENKTQQHILLFLIHNGLKLIAPFMPYLSEELYQRLPVVEEHEKSPSIHVASYPKEFGLYNEKLNEDVNFVKNVIKTMRSTKDGFMASKSKTDCIIICGEQHYKLLLDNTKLAIKSICCIEEITIYDQDNVLETGENYIPGVVNSYCKVYIKIQGNLDIKNELEKQKNKLGKLEPQLKTAINIIERFDDSVSEEVKQTNKIKYENIKTEVDSIKTLIEIFSKKL